MTTSRDIAWWYWLLTVGLLSGGLIWDRSESIMMAIVVCAVQILHVFWISRNWIAFPLQVRTAYLALLLASLSEPLHWIHWIQLAGTSARVLIGYCFLARALSLAPWNRWQPLTPALIKRAFLSWHAAVPPCGEVFRRTSFEQVQG
ncbi:hypothetical protein [Petrachloros mirabilis]